jgi:release factor glutamine methyltransferase
VSAPSLTVEVASALEAAGVRDSHSEAGAIIEAAGGDRDTTLVLAARRISGSPLALLTGRTTFMGLELLVEQGVLAPREETELLANVGVTLVREVADATGSARAVDIGCGAGNLACAIAAAVPQCEVFAADVATAAAVLTRRNAERLGLGARVHVCEGDLFEAVAGLDLERTVDVVVCNPPYISTGRLSRDRATLLEHEPREAFDAGPLGISILQRVIRDAPEYLKAGGWLALEVGAGQARFVETMFVRAAAYDPVLTAADADGEPRVVYGCVR